jgi:nitrite reductase (NADH) large subunit
VVDDSEGIADMLDEAMQRSVNAFRDPWLEADAPATSHQFTETLPIVQ